METSVPGDLRVALCDAYPHLRGGAQAQLRHLVVSAPGEGVHVTVVVPGLGALPRATARSDAPTVVVPATGALARYGGRPTAAMPARLPGYWARARRAFTDIAVAHVNDHRGVLLFGPPARAAGARVVWHCHALQPGRALNRLCAGIADVVVAPTAAAARQLESVSGRRARVVPGHAPTPPSWRPTGGPTVATIGRLHETKGLGVLVDALARLRPTHPDVEALIVGGEDPVAPGTRRALDRRVARLGLDRAVRFVGHRDDPWEDVTRASLYVQPSRTETEGLALRQAMAAGMPVVATDLPAFREVVEHGQTGLLVPPGDPAALADAIARLLDAPEHAAALGRAAAAQGSTAVSPTASLVTLWREVAR